MTQYFFHFWSSSHSLRKRTKSIYIYCSSSPNAFKVCTDHVQTAASDWIDESRAAVIPAGAPNVHWEGSLLMRPKELEASGTSPRKGGGRKRKLETKEEEDADEDDFEEDAEVHDNKA